MSQRLRPAGRAGGDQPGLFLEADGQEEDRRPATIEFLPPLPQGLSKAEFMARMEDVIETRTNQLIAQARGEPVKPSVLVEWNGRKNVAPCRMIIRIFATAYPFRAAFAVTANRRPITVGRIAALFHSVLAPPCAGDDPVGNDGRRLARPRGGPAGFAVVASSVRSGAVSRLPAIDIWLGLIGAKSSTGHSAGTGTNVPSSRRWSKCFVAQPVEHRMPWSDQYSGAWSSWRKAGAPQARPHSTQAGVLVSISPEPRAPAGW
jgi:hypothetical protein